MKIEIVYKLGEVFKDRDSEFKTKQWGVQMPHGRLFFKTKKEANQWADTLRAALKDIEVTK